MDTNTHQMLDNNDWEVLTDTGWSDFSCLKVSTAEFFYKISLSSGKFVRVTKGHRIMSVDGWVCAENINISDIIITDGTSDEVVDITTTDGGNAYDLVGVKKNSRYYTNGILSHNCDEFAHLAPSLAEEFVASVFPTLSSSQESKLVLVSTPKGFNAFHKIWKEAEEGVNGFVPVTGTWHENPTRTQKWADDQLAVLGKVKFAQEIDCSFIGSSYSLVDGNKMSILATTIPILTKDKMNFFVEPKKDHTYIITVDTSRGQHLDHSAFTVIDITQRPYQVVATFKDNQISPESYPYLIYTTAKQYNNAYVLIEVNDLGEMVASNLFHEFEYENVYFTFKDELNEGRGYPGVRTTKKVKSIGCSTLKGLIEEDQLILNSHQILEEIGVFVQKGASYAAEDETINDDLMTCLWLFAWLTKQPIFAELTSTNIRAVLASNMERYIEDTMIPFGFRDDGMEEAERKKGELDLARFGGNGDPFLKWLFS